MHNLYLFVWFFKGKFYNTTVIPAMLYAMECWAVKNQHKNKISVAKMRMLCLICGETRRYRIRNTILKIDSG